MPYATINTHISPLRLEDVESAYLGRYGCACGCGGEYARADDKPIAMKRRMNVINQAIEDGTLDLVQISGGQIIYEKQLGEDRVVRVYTEWK